MSNLSGSSTGISIHGGRSRFVGVPKRCWCGIEIVSLISKSTTNPYRRYFRCSFAVAEKLRNDDHTYKWVDEGLLDEIEGLSTRILNLEASVNRLKEDRIVLENMIHEKVAMMAEADISNRLQEVVVEAKSKVTTFMLCFE
ncbi:unnamed protein product [Microthlaspi erraticum]|uniref:GRF-type domain-containing protein n=1 Tax=Microthlaspi erraticum TaxID=1685480 RepID=A0A6D2HRF5_9BRAS|nr:unnamed protein product [Microthlaspi erraticum]